jgi:hypothetical protein
MMRIFTPYDDIKLNTTCLSEDDLTIQRNNAMTILETIGGKAKGWQWHPGVTMWITSDDLLACIAHSVNMEWCAVNNDVDSLAVEYNKTLKLMGYSLLPTSQLKFPWWWGHKKFHESNRAAMIRRNREWYGGLFANDDPGICDWWPRVDTDRWTYGPQPSPDGKFDYIIDGKPVFQTAREMLDTEFARHANTFHNLLPDIKTPISSDDPGLSLLKAFHDRFHQKRVYDTHDHR